MTLCERFKGEIERREKTIDIWELLFRGARGEGVTRTKSGRRKVIFHAHTPRKEEDRQTSAFFDRDVIKVPSAASQDSPLLPQNSCHEKKI